MYSRSVISSGSSSNSLMGSNVEMNTTTAIVFVVISLLIALVLFFTIVKMKKRPEGGFMNWLREFFNFREIILEGILKFLYIFFAALTTFVAFYTMFQNVPNAIIIGLLELVVGNIIMRVGFELVMLLVGLWQNTSDIRGFMEMRHQKEFGASPKKVVEKNDEEEKAKASK